MMNLFGSHLKKKLQEVNPGKGSKQKPAESGGGGSVMGLEKMLFELSNRIEMMVTEHTKKIDSI